MNRRERQDFEAETVDIQTAYYLLDALVPEDTRSALSSLADRHLAARNALLGVDAALDVLRDVQAQLEERRGL